MKIAGLGIILSFILCFVSCKTEPKLEAYSNHGVRFEMPEDWTKTEAEIPGAGVTIKIEKEGEDESGYFISNILNNKIPLTTQMQIIIDQLRQNFSMQEIEFDFKEVQSTPFNGTDALTCSYTHKIAGLSFIGTIKTFHCGEKTVYILIQEEEEDRQNNEAGLKTLNDTFTCNS